MFYKRKDDGQATEIFAIQYDPSCCLENFKLLIKLNFLNLTLKKVDVNAKGVLVIEFVNSYGDSSVYNIPPYHYFLKLIDSTPKVMDGDEFNSSYQKNISSFLDFSRPLLYDGYKIMTAQKDTNDKGKEKEWDRSKGFAREKILKIAGKAKEDGNVLQQTDPNLNKTIQSYGCLFMALIYFHLKSNRLMKEFTATRVNELYNICINNGALGTNCYVASWNAVLNSIFNYYGGTKEFVYDDGSRTGTNMDGIAVEPYKGEEPYIGSVRTTYYDNHFLVMRKDKIIYDPYVGLERDYLDRYELLELK